MHGVPKDASTWCAQQEQTCEERGQLQDVLGCAKEQDETEVDRPCMQAVGTRNVRACAHVKVDSEDRYDYIVHGDTRSAHSTTMTSSGSACSLLLSFLRMISLMR